MLKLTIQVNMKRLCLKNTKELRNSLSDIIIIQNVVINQLLINLNMKRKLYKLSLFKEIDEFN